MLAWDEADPHAGKELAEAQSALTAAERRAVEAERALEEYRAEQESTAAEREEAEVTKFKTDHAWLYEEGASGDVKAAVSDLIQRGMLPTRAGDVFKGVDPKEQAVMAESIRRGDSVDTARELARLKTAAPTKPALPKPPPGEEFISGTEPAGRTERRKRAPNEASSARETRYMMAEHMTAA